MVPSIAVVAGDIRASAKAVMLKTLVGSCVAICLFDPVSQVGGMNHYMLPYPDRAGDIPRPGRFGSFATAKLIREVISVGGARERLQAKAFGGGHVTGENTRIDVPQKNIAFLHEVLEREGIPLMASDLGGTLGRRIHFETHTGRAWVRRLNPGVELVSASLQPAAQPSFSPRASRLIGLAATPSAAPTRPSYGHMERIRISSMPPPPWS